MANLAQTINVLQALILTRGSQLLLTPTYHIFNMYKVHQDAKLLPVNFQSPDYTIEDQKIPAVNLSASIDSTGAVHISLVNLNPNRKISLRASLPGVSWKAVSGQILTSAKLTDINNFENPGKIKLVSFGGAKKEGDQLLVELPAQSVVMLELK